MPASWKKIILSGSEAHLTEITASQGIQISPGGVSTVGADNDNQKVLVIDATSNGNVLGVALDDVGSEGTSIISFVTMSIGGTVSGDTNILTSGVNDTLFITSSLGNPLTIAGTDDDANDSITFTVATHSREDVEDVSSLFLSASNLGTEDVHSNFTINYTDNGVSPGTFSLTGSKALSGSNTSGQTGVTLAVVVLPAATQVAMVVNGATNTSDVIFNNITSSYYAPIDSVNSLGDGNISQTTNIAPQTPEPLQQGYGNPQTNTLDGDGHQLLADGSVKYTSASAIHIINEAGIGNDLTMSGDFIFQGFTFGDAQVLTHTGNNIFGSGSMPAALDFHHQFTGSLLITGSDITLQQSNSFNGDGSGLTNLTTSSIEGLGLLSGSDQISSDIQGAFTADEATIALSSSILLNGSQSGQFSAITSSVSIAGSDLGSSGQIHTFYSANAASFTGSFIPDNYIISASADDTSGLDIVTTGAIGSGPISQTIVLDITKLTDGETDISGSDDIMFRDISNGARRKGTIDSLSFMTASSEGTVTNISAGNGIFVTHGTGYDGTTAVDTTIDILLSGSGGSVGNNANTYQLNDLNGYTTSDLIIENSPKELGLNPKVNITSITAATGSFTELKVTAGDIASLETETVLIKDNFMILNNNVIEDDEGNNEDAGISIQRGNLLDANLFWEENAERWSINKANLQPLDGSFPVTSSATPDSYLITTEFGDTDPPLTPTYGGGDYGEGNIFIKNNSTNPKVFIWA